MTMKITTSSLLILCVIALQTTAQQLKPGFNKAEYMNLLKASARFGDSTYFSTIPEPDDATFVYRSKIMGLDNQWDLWLRNDRVAIISIRGTTQNPASWLANFYAAMVPAQGELQLNETEKFTYALSSHPRAAVHIGWLVSTAFLAKDILPKIDSCYQSGITDVVIMGHSQGGAIAYLLTAHLHSLQQQQKLPSTIRFKTYCSAAPKPGNLYFAYSYEAMTQQGWAYNVVNSADWVPEVPMSIQTTNDFNKTNPFIHARASIKQQKFPKNIALKKVYNNLDKPTRRAQRNYQKYLGNLASKLVTKNIPGYVQPAYYESNHYVRTGHTVILLADEPYFEKYPDDTDKIFTHHFHTPYLALTDKLVYEENTPANTKLISGQWLLNYITGKRIAFDGLYPEKRPTLKIDEATNTLSGNTSCNQFTVKFSMAGSSLLIPPSMAMTKMFCPGEGEQVFIHILQKINRYNLTQDGQLELLQDDMVMMRFEKVNP